jgi:hypothetical protein
MFDFYDFDQYQQRRVDLNPRPCVEKASVHTVPPALLTFKQLLSFHGQVWIFEATNYI